MVIRLDLQIYSDGIEFLPDVRVRAALFLNLLIKILKKHLRNCDVDIDLHEFGSASAANKKWDGQNFQRFYG